MIRKQLDWVVETVNGYSPTCSRSKSLSTKLANERNSSTVLPNCSGEDFETRRHVDRRTDYGEVEPAGATDIAVHDAPTRSPRGNLRRTTGFPVLFVQGNHGLTASATACSRFAQACGWLSGKMASGPSPMNFSISPPCRAIAPIASNSRSEDQDVIARPAVGDLGEIRKSQIMMAAITVVPLLRLVALARCARRMRPDIGFEQRSRQPVFHTDFADQRQNRQQFQQAGDLRIVKTTWPVGCKGHDMPLAERMVQRPRHIVGRPFARISS